MLLGARQFFAAKKAAPTPPGPYDYEVEWIERDCSIPWVDGDGVEIEGYFDLNRYEDSSETLGTMRPIEVTWSFEPLKTGLIYSFVRKASPFYIGGLKIGNYDVYGFRIGVFSGILGDLSVMRTQLVEYRDGKVKGYMDGILTVEQTMDTAVRFSNDSRLMYSAKTTAKHYSGKMRVAAAKFGDDVDLVPVVKGNAVGFYNKVDGELFLAEQACLSAGPAK